MEERLTKIINYDIVEQKQQVIINNVAGEVVKKVLVLNCPKCNNVLYSNGYEGHLNAFFDALQKEGFVNYCPHCGQKLEVPTMVETTYEAK